MLRVDGLPQITVQAFSLERGKWFVGYLLVLTGVTVLRPGAIW